jgi:tetratricopeptide (TPR) repeat protein/ubiquitin-protein ligase
LPLRTRRLLADAEQMRRTFDGGALIRLQATEGEPPELYRIEYHIRGLSRGPDGQPVPRDTHLVEIQLTSEYPRVSPRCRVLTPIFHPNIDLSTICVGDHWAAGERLVDLVVRIGEMIAYQAYNIKSPLDGEAAMWADLNQQRLPLDGRDLRPAEDEGPVPPAAVADALLKAATTALPVAGPPAAPAESTAPPRPSEDHTQPSAGRPREGAPAPAGLSRRRGGRAVVVLMVGLIACTIWAVAAMLVERSDRQAAEKARQEAEAARRAAEKARGQAVQDVNAARAAERQANESEQRARANEQTALADKEKAARSEADTRAALAFFRGRVLAKWPFGQEGQPPSAAALRGAVDTAEPDVGKEFGARPEAEAAVRDMLGRTYGALSEPARAVPQYERAFALCQQVYGPNDARTLATLEDLGVAYRHAGKPEKTVELYKDLVNRVERGHGPHSREALQAWNKLGVAYWAAKQFDPAIEQFKKTHEAMRAGLRADNWETLQTLTNLAVSYRDGGRPSDALRCFEEALQHYRAKFPPDHPGRLTCLQAFAETYERSGQWAKAVPLHEERLKGVNARYHPDSPQAFDARTDLAWACGQAGDLGRAEKLLCEQLETCRKKPGPEELLTASALAMLAHNLFLQKKYGDAEPLVNESLTIREQKQPDSWRRYSALSLLGAVLMGQKKYADAETALVRGYEGLKKREATIPPRAWIHPADALEWLVQLYDAWDKKDKADEWREKRKQADVPRPLRAQDEKLLSLQSLNSPKTYVRSRDGLGFTTEISSELDRKDASWYVCPGLAGGDTVSFRSVNYPKQYLRHQEGRVKLHDFEDADLFKQDASFKRINGLGKGGGVSFESVNYPGCFLRHKDGELWVERNDGSELFAKDATFRIVEPFYKP